MSTHRRIYLDHNATSPLIPAAAEAVREALEAAGSGGGGNPSSIHAEGRAARDRVERAREVVAGWIGRPREEVVFTSGGTEANAVGVAALAAEVERRGGPRVVATSAMDHPSLQAAVARLVARGWEVRDVRDLQGGVGVIATALVNHEVGTLVGELEVGEALVHLDCVQAAGKMVLGGVRADSIAVSAHKIGGPQGVGAVALRVEGGEGGGHQERGRRGGTENVLGIVGFGAAARRADPAGWEAVRAVGERLERGLRALGVRIHGGEVARVGGTINAGFAGARGESIVVALDLAGVAASTGAACTSGSVQPSPVLMAMGLTEEEAREAVRFSIGRGTTVEEVEEVIGMLPAIVERARRHR